ncbi:MAG: NDP-sugar synthase, partial [Sphingobacteriaceae bacterium]
MEYAIIAAGEGSRLASEGVTQPKPLVPLAGQPLIGRLMNIFATNGAEKIHVIINAFMPAVESYLHNLQLTIPVNIIKKTTSSSLHSFYELLSHIEGDTVCLSTVDTIFQDAEFSHYTNTFLQHPEYDALMAATSFIDDEKPLYIATDADDNITHYLDQNTQNCKLVSGGIYCLRRSTFAVVQQAIADKVDRMRNLQRLLIKDDLVVKAYPFSKIMDID